MRISGLPAPQHLTYCTNVHAAEDLPAVLDALRQHLPAIKADASPDAPFGVGLRLSASAAEALQQPDRLQALREVLDENDCYVVTINGFPFGPFHGQPVKENVYAPDWGEDVRLVYTDWLADILTQLLPEGEIGSVSTVPLTFRPWAEGRLDLITRNLLRHIAHLVGIRERTGRMIAVALEPEPCCYLETVTELRSYFEERLFTAEAARMLADMTGLSEPQASDAIRRHAGICYDVCHAAVEYEIPGDSIRLLRSAGISIPKLQLSSAIRIPEVSPAVADWLRPFDEPVYLHQVIERRDGSFRRYRDLPDALASIEAASGAEWRVHFHVPVFLAELEHASTTQDFLREILKLHRAEPISEHLEVETYTWGVLPAAYRTADVSCAIARELLWVRDRLTR